MIRTRMSVLILLGVFVATGTGMAQTAPRPSDVESPEAIVLAAYASIAREPGQPFDWDRFRSLFRPDARLIPNTEQRQGSFDVLTAEGFIEWIQAFTPSPGTANDQGFQEEQVSAEVVRYGDVAHVFSTYQKHFWGSEEILGRGINSFQLVQNGGRWWIAGIAWDEENGAGPIPAEYLP